ncbi:zinc-binding protein A33-like isoform X2 [Lissotriton helveticus]
MPSNIQRSPSLRCPPPPSNGVQLLPLKRNVSFSMTPQQLTAKCSPPPSKCPPKCLPSSSRRCQQLSPKSLPSKISQQTFLRCPSPKSQAPSLRCPSPKSQAPSLQCRSPKFHALSPQCPSPKSQTLSLQWLFPKSKTVSLQCRSPKSLPQSPQCRSPKFHALSPQCRSPKPQAPSPKPQALTRKSTPPPSARPQPLASSYPPTPSRRSQQLSRKCPISPKSQRLSPKCSPSPAKRSQLSPATRRAIPSPPRVFTFEVDQQLLGAMQQSSSYLENIPGILSSEIEHDEKKIDDLVACTTNALNINEDLTCKLCQGLFQNPVLLKCGHDFCRTCIDGACVGRVIGSCPVCKANFIRGDHRPIMALARLVERVKEEFQINTSKEYCGDQLENQKDICKNGKCKVQCEDHQEKLQFFCKDDGVLICIICRDAPKHADHVFMPVQKAVGMYKGQLSAAVDQMASARSQFDRWQTDHENARRIYEREESDSETSISSCFKKYLRPLENQKLATLNKLAFQDKVAQKQMVENLTKLKEDRNKVQYAWDDVQMRLKEQDPFEFLNGIQSCLKRCSELKTVNSEVVWADIHKHEFRGPTAFSLWKKIKCSVCPAPSVLTLDPGTAHCELVLSEDRASVWYVGPKQAVPHRHERCAKTPAVLASKSFTSGTHYWEVHVGTAPTWVVGVVLESRSCPRNDPRFPGKELGLLQRNQNKYEALGVKKPVLSLSSRPQKIVVYLESGKSRVSFFDANSMCHIHTHTFQCISSPEDFPIFYPYFSPCTGTASKHSEPLTIC